MEYNKEFLEQFISYVEITYGSVENAYKDVLSKKIYTNEGLEEIIKKVFEDYINVIKYMEFCKGNDEFFDHNIEKSIQVLNEAMTSYEQQNIVLLCDYLYYGLSNELMEIFKAVDSRIASME